VITPDNIALNQVPKHSVYRCKDLDYIKSVLFDDEMWDRSSDDHIVKTDSLIANLGCIWLKCYHYEKPMGIASIALENSSVVNVHIHIPKENRGRHTKGIGLSILRWVKDNANPNIHKINTKIPVIYKDVIRFAHSLGFKDEGIDRLSIMKNGKLIDRLNLGITFEEVS